MIRVLVNDEARELPPHTTLQQALEQWQVEGERIACAINGEFTPRSRYEETLLCEGDRIDLVKPIGGG
ncbi:sulfur carrier protein ThiS [Pseudomaricurvus sp. HS19]|uniref:sulfur carrier protein ThiS n=1 Tax=Pseudomaricurvus sp. HS19 TaxID=2692626 RepID=UPI00136B1B4D|nr:sulfur carrier protein ThiS [Pseudomaricurvus sp. HS19]MYM61779.1 sulfur carrier protein ThiS [Pseudomaricurvus sp. HS19]